MLLAKGPSIMDVDIPAVAVPGSGTASPPLTVSQVGHDTANRRTLAALGFGTFVAALVFVVPPIFFPRWRPTCR